MTWSIIVLKKVQINSKPGYVTRVAKWEIPKEFFITRDVRERCMVAAVVGVGRVASWIP